MNGLSVNHGMISAKLDFTVTKSIKITRDSHIRYSTFVRLYVCMNGDVSTVRELILIILNQEICISRNLTLGSMSVFFEGTGNQVGRDGLVRY
jgi:hypothetical protein